LNPENPQTIVVILGPTASGKTRLAVEVAKRINGAIISADSRQIFRGMDIGTGKDLDVYEDIPHYLIDIRAAGDHYHVAQYQQDFQQALNAMRESGRRPILCGGTGLYLHAALAGFAYSAVPVSTGRRAILEQLDKATLVRMLESLPPPPNFFADTSTKKRLIRAIEIAEWSQNHALPEDTHQPPAACIFGIDPPLEIRRQRITERLTQRLDAGLLNEVETLLNGGVSAQQLIRYGLEYKYTTSYLLGALDYDTYVARLNTEIHRFAKRQMTYFRKMEKEGFAIHWLRHGTVEEMAAELLGHIK